MPAGCSTYVQDFAAGGSPHTCSSQGVQSFLLFSDETLVIFQNRGELFFLDFHSLLVEVDVAPLLATPPVLIDASAQMLAQARRRLAAINCRATVVEGDAFDLPFPSQFDLVYTFRLIRHFELEDRRRLYRQIARVLKPGGMLVFDAVNEVVSRPLRERASADEHRHFDALLTPDRLRQELREEGFEVERLVGVQHQYPLLLQTQILVGPRSRFLARAAMEVIDRLGGEPLEWVVMCRRK